MKRFKNLYLHYMGLSHILLILTWRGRLGKSWFGLVWRNSSKDLESILGLSVGLFLFNWRHCIRCFCGFWTGFRLLRAQFPCRNSRDKKSRREFESPLINSISKSKTDKIACHLAKIYFETIFWTSFWRISFALLHSTRRRNFLLKTSSWNFWMHKAIAKISFLIVE